jgi:hypothetical protein
VTGYERVGVGVILFVGVCSGVWVDDVWVGALCGRARVSLVCGCAGVVWCGVGEWVGGWVNSGWVGGWVSQRVLVERVRGCERAVGNPSSRPAAHGSSNNDQDRKVSSAGARNLRGVCGCAGMQECVRAEACGCGHPRAPQLTVAQRL